MKSRSWLFTLAVLGVGAALGYAAATGRLNPLPKAEATPRLGRFSCRGDDAIATMFLSTLQTPPVYV